MLSSVKYLMTLRDTFNYILDNYVFFFKIFSWFFFRIYENGTRIESNIFVNFLSVTFKYVLIIQI